MSVRVRIEKKVRRAFAEALYGSAGPPPRPFMQHVEFLRDPPPEPDLEPGTVTVIRPGVNGRVPWRFAMQWDGAENQLKGEAG